VGIPPEEITDAMLKLDPSDELRKLRTAAAGHPNAALTSDEAMKKQFRRLERREQNLFAGWLKPQEEKGILVYDWSATNRRVTCRTGMPDFKIYRQGRVLFGEMKIDKGSLSEAQRLMHDRFLASSTEVQIWDTADTAIRRVRAWLWEHWRLWQEGEPGE
jgi:hypothetical protein